jgi:periodic tryptophan protein 1
LVEVDPALAREFDLDHYDDGDDAVDGAAAVMRMFGGANLRGLRYYASNEEDPFITLKDEVQPRPPLTGAGDCGTDAGLGAAGAER